MVSVAPFKRRASSEKKQKPHQTQGRKNNQFRSTIKQQSPNQRMHTDPPLLAFFKGYNGFRFQGFVTHSGTVVVG